MKIKNKKTGEIKAVQHNNLLLHFSDGTTKCYHSIKELNEDFEDYEEPKDFWYIDSGGEVEEATYLTDIDKYCLRSFGNYFETKEEAEKAVEKLRAWKRLKDKGFNFKDFARVNDCAAIIRATFDESWSEIYDDLDLIFGGEE